MSFILFIFVSLAFGLSQLTNSQSVSQIVSQLEKKNRNIIIIIFFFFFLLFLFGKNYKKTQLALFFVSVLKRKKERNSDNV